MRLSFQPSSKKQQVSSPYDQNYTLETENNFRFLSRLLATRSKYILNEADRIDDEAHYAFLSDIGQYAELAHGLISPDFIFRNIAELCQPGFPLDGYKTLENDNALLIKSFKGDVADVQGYVALRPHSEQLVIAFSGTSNLSQALRDIQTCKTVYPRDKRSSRVHLGLWSMYLGIRMKAMNALQLGFSQNFQVSSIVVTGHSMGSTLCYLLALDLIADLSNTTPNNHAIPSGIPLSLVVFGSPRLGNKGLVEFWRNSVHQYRHRFGQDSFREYSIKAYNDGAHTLPLCWMGYRHLTGSPQYLYHGYLYQIPQTECEHGVFTVIDSTIDSRHTYSHDTQGLTASVNHPGHATSTSHPDTVFEPHFDRLIWPRGGHNYYFRDMANLQRRLKWLELESRGEQNWRERYKLRLKLWEEKMAGPFRSPD